MPTPCKPIWSHTPTHIDSEAACLESPRLPSLQSQHQGSMRGAGHACSLIRHACCCPAQGVRFALARRGRALIADEMGIGKTVQAIAVMACYQVTAPHSRCELSSCA